MHRPRTPLAILPLLALALAACGTSRPAPARATGGAVSMPEPHAARAALAALDDGGNAIDAAVCAGFVLAVTHPEAGNLGGGSFFVVHTPKESFVVDARETAPRAARRDTYLDRDGNVRPEVSTVGPLAAGVPGTVAGLLLLHERGGRLPRERVLAPAIQLAEEGFRVDDGLRASLERHRALLERFPESARVFLPGGNVPRTLKQPELARVLKAISLEGAPGFYRGWFAELVQNTCSKHAPGWQPQWITIGDLYTYTPKVREVLRGTYRGHEVLTMPPPSSGGVVMLQMLDMLERGGYAGMRPEQRLHLFAEAGKRAFADRAAYFGDPDFADVPVAELLDPAYVQRRFLEISMTAATPSTAVAGGLGGEEGGCGGSESEETCHFSVIDREGNAVACTTTLNGAYGCGLAVSGVLLNNEMDAFTFKPGVPNICGLIQGEANAVAPGKRPLSSMTPTILLKDGKPVLALGSPGGPTIISTVAQVLANHLALGMALPAAVAAPRIHHQWLPDEVIHEELTPEQVRSLTTLGHVLHPRERPMGDVQAVGYVGGLLTGVADPRGRGSNGR